MSAIILFMPASDVQAIADPTVTEVGPEAQETAARLTALMRHVYLYDRGSHLRVIEESGLTMTQTKVLLELGGLGPCAAEAWQVSDLAEQFGVSVPSMSRAVDALVKDGLATRLEDPDDRRVRRVGITAAGRELVEKLAALRQTGLASFAATLTAAQRLKLDTAVDALMDREDIAQTYRHLRRDSQA